MLDACVQTIVRNGDDYLYPCIAVIAPHVKRIRITVDNRSADSTYQVAERLSEEFPNVEVRSFHVENPFEDVVAMRNSQLGFPEKWGFIVDSDEYHQDIASYTLQDAPGYAFQSWAVWKPHFAHKASCKAIIGRIFLNGPSIHWLGRFNKEMLYNGEAPVFHEPVLLPFKYIHFTHVKKENWRFEMGKERVADGRDLTRIPKEVADTIRDIHEKMQIVPGWRL